MATTRLTSRWRTSSIRFTTTPAVSTLRSAETVFVFDFIDNCQVRSSTTYWRRGRRTRTLRLATRQVACLAVMLLTDLSSRRNVSECLARRAFKQGTEGSLPCLLRWFDVRGELIERKFHFV